MNSWYDVVIAFMVLIAFAVLMESCSGYMEEAERTSCVQGAENHEIARYCNEGN